MPHPLSVRCVRVTTLYYKLTTFEAKCCVDACEFAEQILFSINSIPQPRGVFHTFCKQFCGDEENSLHRTGPGPLLRVTPFFLAHTKTEVRLETRCTGHEGGLPSHRTAPGAHPIIAPTYVYIHASYSGPSSRFLTAF